MQLALDQATLAERAGEVPVGAVLLLNNEVIASGFNQPILDHDPTAHAEIVVMRKAAQLLQNYRLVDTTLVVTLEPCAMCAAAMVHARVGKLIYGATDPKAGAVESIMHLLDEPKLNHRVFHQGGVKADACGQVLKDFFKAKR